MFEFFREMFRNDYVDWDTFSSAFKVPRKTMSLPENRFLTTLSLAIRKPLLDVRQTAISMRVPSRLELSTVDGIARGQPADGPFVSAFNGYPQAVLRLSEPRHNVLQQMRLAVKKGRVLLNPDLATYPSYPILTLRFLIFDNRKEPFIAENLADICNGDVQDFCARLYIMRQGKLHLYEGGNLDARCTVSGTFTLWIPRTSEYSFEDIRVPYRPKREDKDLFVSLLWAAAKHLKGIPSERQDYESAALLHKKKVSISGEQLTAATNVLSQGAENELFQGLSMEEKRQALDQNEVFWEAILLGRKEKASFTHIDIRKKGGKFAISENAYSFVEKLSDTEIMEAIELIKLNVKAKVAVRAGNRREALRLYEQILTKAPFDSIAMMSIGTQWAHLGDRAKAIEWMEKALHSDPGNARIRNNLKTIKRNIPLD